VDDPAGWIDLLKALQGLGFLGGIVAVLVVFYKGWYVSRNEMDRQVAAVEEKVQLLRAELEKREGLYIASLAELRATIREGAEQRDRIQAALDKNIGELYRFTDVLTDIRSDIRARSQSGT
jgi:hypothetical protein